MKSMTGYGRALHSGHGRRPTTDERNETRDAKVGLPEIEVAIRSVNGRYLETRLHIPREYGGLESDLKAVLSKVFSRGTLDIYVNRGRSVSTTDLTVNTELAMKWLDGYRALGQALKLEAQPSLELLTRIPDVLKIEEHSETSDAEKALLKSLVEKAAELCDRERIREGAALAAELDQLCLRLEALTSEMLTLREEANAELEKRLRDRLQKLGFTGVLDDHRMAQEVMMQVDRSDISEELTRLREHVKAYRALLLSHGSEGKKLDFYAQELLREVNTIGSKSQVARLTALVVEAKTIVEKIREQVQNVE